MVVPVASVIQRVAIAVHDQRACGDRRQRSGREIHVFAVVRELARMAPQGAALVIAIVMARSHVGPLAVAASLLRHGAHNPACLIGKPRCATDMNHRADPIRLLRGHVEQRIGAGAHANRLDAIDRKAIEQCDYVAGDVGEAKHA